MVGFKNMSWIPEIGALISESPKKKAQNLGILAFETAKTMSRLISIYKSLSNEEMLSLRKDVMKSEGVRFLNSTDEGFLLSLACAERVEDLDRAAVAVARLGKKCEDLGLNRFDILYTDLKLGLIDLGKLEYGSRRVERKVRKMEKLVSTTSCLHAALEGLTEMEVSERKMQVWKNRQVQLQKDDFNFGLFHQKLENQRKEVRHFREVSLWCQTFDRSVDLMARIVCIVYARICVVFGPYVPVLTSTRRNIDSHEQQQRGFPLILPFKEHMLPHSGPMLSSSKPHIVRFYSQRSFRYSNEPGKFGADEENGMRNNRVMHAAGPSTLGGSGLANRYANVIILAEKYLNSTASIDHDERESLYEMLPENLKAMIRTKLSKNIKCADGDADLAKGWREAMVEMMGWLAPMAHNTTKWQMERNFERTKFCVKPSVLLLQTLHFSDREKTEAAIAEVLVGLSCIYRFENRQC